MVKDFLFFIFLFLYGFSTKKKKKNPKKRTTKNIMEFVANVSR